MTGRERLWKAFHFEQPDRLPFAPLIDEYFMTDLPRQGYDFDILQAMRYMGFDFLERHVEALEPWYSNGVTYSEKWEGNYLTKRFDTPIGSVTEERDTTVSIVAIRKNYICSYKDIAVYKYIMENTHYRPFEQQFIDRDLAIGDNGMATGEGLLSPIQEVMEYGCGLEKTIYYLADYEEEMEDLMEAIHRRNLEYYRELAKTSVKVVIDYEDTSTTTMSRRYLTDYSIPYIEEYSKIMRDAGKIFITHMCGKLTGFLEEISNLQVDGVDSLCPPNTGDLQCWDARKRFGDSKVIIGGIDPIDLVRLPIDKVLEKISEILLKMEDKRGFILSTGDATPHGTKVETLMTINRFIELVGNRAFEKTISEDFLIDCRKRALEMI